jgi:GMP synthase-like glutamine amidotransferase
MNVTVFQHAPFEGLGSISRWLSHHDATPQIVRLYDGDPIPASGDIEFLIVMGGPMSANDEPTLDWLAPEKQAIREAVSRRIPVLGVCLGAQLIASALGARVYPNAVKEIGWFPIYAVPGPASMFRFPIESRVFHWHGETFDLPPGALHLARSAACDDQAFQIGRHVIGLQFHLEATCEAVRGMVEHCRADLEPGPYVQTEAGLNRAPASWYESTNQLMDDVLTYLVERRQSLLA